MGTKKGQKRKTARRAYKKKSKDDWRKLFDKLPKARFPTGSLKNAPDRKYR